MNLPWSRSITVSTSGFHPDNAGSTPAEITRKTRKTRRALFVFLILAGVESVGFAPSTKCEVPPPAEIAKMKK